MSAQSCGVFTHTSQAALYGYDTTQVFFDRFGNKYAAEELALPQIDHPETQTCTTPRNLFNLVFMDCLPSSGIGFDDPALGAARRAVVCEVFADIEAFLNFPMNGQQVQIRINSFNGGVPGALATASPIYMLPPGPNPTGIIDNDVYLTINTGIDPNITRVNLPTRSVFHGILSVNWDFPYHLGLAPPNAGNFNATDFDLYPVILHEAMHLLGFTSLMDQTGGGFRLNFVPQPIYSRWDVYTRDAAGIPLLNIPNTGGVPLFNAPVNYQGGANALTPLVCNISFASQAGPVTIHTPNLWRAGASMNHIFCDASCSPLPIPHVMAECIDPGLLFAKRLPSQEEADILCTLGYRLNSTFGTSIPPFSVNTNTVRVYNNCNQPCVAAGRNDGLTPAGTAAFVMDASNLTRTISIPITTLTANDLPSLNVGLVNPRPLLPANAQIALAGANLNYTAPAGFSGWAVFSYVPVCTGGAPGNITYVYVWVEPDALPPCTGSCENLLCYGDFEVFTNANALPVSLLMLSPPFLTGTLRANSPDIFPRFAAFGANFQQNCLPQNFASGNFLSASPQPSATTNPNNQYIGLRNGSYNLEGIYFELGQALDPAQQYEIFYDQSSACSTAVQFAFSNNPPCRTNTLAQAVWTDPGPTYNCAIGQAYQPLYKISGPVVNTQPANSPPLWTRVGPVLFNPGTAGADHVVIHVTPLAGGFIQTLSPYTYLDNIVIRPVNRFPLTATASVQPLPACAGQTLNINWQICINNPNLPFPAAGIRLRHILPAGFTGTGGNFTQVPGQAQWWEVTLFQGDFVSGCAQVNMQADVSTFVAAGTYAHSLQAVANACFDILPVADVAVRIPATLSKSANRLRVFPGQTLNYSLDICNPDPTDTLFSVRIVDNLPAGLSLISAPGGWNISGQSLISPAFNLPPAPAIGTPACTTFVIQTTLDDVFESCQPLENCAYLDNTGCFTLPACVTVFPVNANGTIGAPGVTTLASTLPALAPLSPVFVEGRIVADLLQWDLTGVELIMAPGSSIEIPLLNHKVILYDTHLHGCDAMWDGIDIYDFEAGLYMQGGSSIRDAEIAVESFGGVAGGKYFIDDSRLENNHIHLAVHPLASTHFGVLRNSTLTSSALLPPRAGQQTETGIWVREVQSLNIGNDNRIENARFGLDALNTKLSSLRNTWRNLSGVGMRVRSDVISWLPVYHDLVVQKDTFRQCFRGMDLYHHVNLLADNCNFEQTTENAIMFSPARAGATPQQNHIRITASRFQGGLNGIWLQDMSNTGMEIRGNQLDGFTVHSVILNNARPAALQTTMSQIPKQIRENNPINGSHIGIAANRVVALDLLNNQINTFSAQNTIIPDRGMRLEGNRRLLISGNTVSNDNTAPMHRGYHLSINTDVCMLNNLAQLSGRGVAFSGSHPRTQFIQNTMQNAHDGLLIENRGIIGAQPTQAGPTLSVVNQNQWTGTFTRGQTRTEGSTDGVLSPFFVGTGPGTNFNPTVNTFDQIPSAPIIFIQVQSPIQSQGCRPFNSAPGPLSYYQSIANGTAEMDESGLHLHRRWLFELLAADSLPWYDDPVLMAFGDSCYDAPVYQLLQTGALADSGRLVDAWYLNQSISSTVPAEQLEREVNRIWIEHQLSAQDTLNLVQREVLEIIAAYCPASEGPAVHQARAILAWNHLMRNKTAPYWPVWEDNCPGGGGQQRMIEVGDELETAVKAPLLKAYPNPAAERLILAYQLETEGDFRFELLDGLGRVVLTQVLDTRGRGHVLDIRKLPAGLYYGRWILNYTMLQSERQVIVR